MKPLAASGRPSRSRIRPRTMSSVTSSPASMAALARLPSSVPRVTASRNRSPDETWGMPVWSRRRWACVPLPEPGAPRSTSLMLRGRSGSVSGGAHVTENAPRGPEAASTENRHRTCKMLEAGARRGYPWRLTKARKSTIVDIFSGATMKQPTGPRNAFYAQSGGVTAVINASACGVIETARKHPRKIGKDYAGRNGILGALTEDLIDTGKESAADIRALRHTTAGAFGSARYKLKKYEDNPAQYERLLEVFKAHDIGYFFYNGGGDSADTCFKVSQLAG